MAYGTIKYEISDSILTVTLNRPEKLNATNPQMDNEIMDALNRADEDDNVKVVIFTGTGRAFCAGADLSAGAATFDFEGGKGTWAGKDDINTHRDAGGLTTLRIFDMKKPMIAAINGPAVGFGISMTLPMDIRLASETAKMGFVYGRRGVLMEAACGWFLPRVVGISQALDWILSGRVFPSKEALAGGLVKEVLPPDALLPRAREIAREIATNCSAVSIAIQRQILWKCLGADHPIEAHKLDSKGMYWLGSQPDAIEGVDSFVQKRPPKFSMRPSKDMPPFYPWWKEKKFSDPFFGA